MFLIGTFNHWYGLYATIALFFLNLACVGIIYPNAAALALAPFGEQAGRAAALLGFLQMGVGALASTGVGLLNAHEALPAIAVLVISALIGFVIYTWGKRQITALAEISPENAAIAAGH